MILNAENYFSLEADRGFMSCSQFKIWDLCELQAYHRYVLGTTKQKDKKCFDEGHFVHSYFEGREEFHKHFYENIEKYTCEKGRAPNKVRVLRSEFKKALRACIKANRDNYIRTAMVGESEKIFTGKFAGTEWKIKVDRVTKDEPYRFSDLKYVKTLQRDYWVNGYLDDYGDFKKEQENHLWFEKNIKTYFYEHWNYWQRFAVYWKVLYVATGKSFTPYLPAISKEVPADIEVYGFADEFRLKMELDYIEEKMPRILDVKLGREKPKGCGKCALCRKYKKITRIVEAESIFK